MNNNTLSNKCSSEPRANSTVRYITRRVVEKPQVTHRLSPIYLPQTNMRSFTNTEPFDMNESEPVPCYIMPVMYLEQQVLDEQTTLPKQNFEIPQKTAYISARKYEPYMDNFDDQNYCKTYSRYYLLPQSDNLERDYDHHLNGTVGNFEYYNKDYDSATSFNVSGNYYTINPKFEYGTNETPVKETMQYPGKKIESKRKTSRGSQTTLNESNFYLYQTSSPIECRATQTFKEHGEKNLTSIATQTRIPIPTRNRLGLFGCGLSPMRNLDHSSTYNIPNEKNKYRTNLANISENDSSKLPKNKKQTKQYSPVNNNLTNKEPLTNTSHLNSQFRRKKE